MINKPINQNLPYRLLRLNDACNLKCIFCNVPPESSAFNELPFPKIKTIINNWSKRRIKFALDISGGEPTLRNDLPNIISYAKFKKIECVQLQTNAFVLSNNNHTKELKRSGLDKAFISLHSEKPKIHDFLVGRNGSFNKTVQGISNLINNNVEVILNPVLTLLNYKTILSYLKFVKREFKEIKYISLSVVQPHQRAWHNRFLLLAPYSLIDKYAKRALSWAENNHITINNPACGMPLCFGDWHKYLKQCSEYNENAYLLKHKNKHGYNINKIKGPQCALCKLSDFCNGVWSNYARVYSTSELKPIQ